MSNYPAICAFCGARLMGGSCPRCRYRKPEGSTVWTPGGIAAVAGAAGYVEMEIFAVGAATNLVLSQDVTISNVTVPAGGTLVVYAGITGDGSQNTLSTVTWGGTTMDSDLAAARFNHNSTLYANVFYLFTVAGGTFNIVASNTDSVREAAFAVANYVMGPVVGGYRQSWHSLASTPVAQASITINVDFSDLEVHALWVSGAVGDPGAWGGGAVGGQGLVVGGTFPGYVATAVGPGRTSDPITPTKALSPSAEWLWHTAEFNAP